MASQTLTVSWKPPADNQLNFSNCDAAAQWWAAALSAQQDINSMVPVNFDVPLDLIRKYMYSLVPSNYTPAPGNMDVVAWYNGGLSTTVARNLTGFPSSRQCGTRVCMYLEWPGDPDISGVGMVISYYMAALFTTIYFVILAFSQLRDRWLRRKNRSHDPGTFVNGFSASVNTFLDAALIFSISMLIAAVTRYSTVVRHPDEHYSIYELIASAYMSTFTIFPALALQSVASDLRRQWLRLFLWFSTIAFVITLEIFYRVLYKTRHWNSKEQESQEALELVWLHKCDSISLRFQLEDTITAGHVFLGFNVCWWLYYVTATLVSKRWKPKSAAGSRIIRWWSSTEQYFRLINGFGALLLMWVFLQLFLRYRSFVANTAGHAYEDDTWTFGQVLALATWVPVVIDLTSIYIFGPEDGLSNKLSKKYKVIAIPVRVAQEPEKGPASNVKSRAESTNLLTDLNHQRGHARSHEAQNGEDLV